MRRKEYIAILMTTAMIAGLSGCTSVKSTHKNTESTTAASESTRVTLSVNSITNKASDTTTSDSTTTAKDSSSTASSGSSNTAITSSDTPVTDTSITATEATGAFTITTTDGSYTQSGSTYKITKAGTYTLKGSLEGQILIEASDADEVVLELAGVTIKNSSDSVIKAVSCGTLEISAKSDTENIIDDNRSNKTTDNDSLGEGAIYAKCDLKIKGTGTLVVTGTYNNGIHTTKDLTVQKLSLKVTAYNNALKGNDSVTVKSGDVVAISTNGDGIKTENTDANKNGETRGDVNILSGNVTVYAAGDGISAAHNYNMTTDSDGNSPKVIIYTGTYSGYSASNASVTSYKGVKVDNELNISAGDITIQSYDDALHADYGTKFDTGETGLGTINITGGTVNVAVYSPAATTGGGNKGPRGGMSVQTVSGADAIHADYILNISGGTINIDSAYEGLEANVINISGGRTVLFANDDGINATKGVKTAAVNISGGYVEVTVSPNGDTDGIDSNGAYTQTGGVVITKGPSQSMAAALDTDGTASVTGGTLICLGYANVKAGSSVKTYSLSLHSAGSHTVTVDGTQYTFSNASAYSKTTVYSSVTVQ